MRQIRPFRSFLLLLAVVPGVLAAQGRGGGEPLRNLQVLPKDMPRNQVTAIMRQFSLALGVRCEHCHAEAPAAAATEAPAAGRGGRGGGGPQLDHALDTKEEKRVAREMLKMVMEINNRFLPATGRTVTDFNRVTCETCHHGLARPQTLRAALTQAVQAKGADSAIALYRALRLRYYGSGAYDFTEQSLNETGSQLSQNPANRQAAIAIVKLNLEFFPQSVPTIFTLANVSVAAGDTAGAVEAINRGLAVQPDNNQLRNLLQRLRPGGGW